MAYKTVQFFCPEPCEGQIYIFGAVIRPDGITLVGKCGRCGKDAHLDVNNLLREMCQFTEGVQ